MSRHTSRGLRRASRGILLLVALLLVDGCASSGTGGGAVRGGANVITRDQLSQDDENAFLIVRRLRPAWLRPRSQQTPGRSDPAFAQVFLDDQQVGDVDYLYRISAAQIDRIEYMSALDATTRYGTGYAGGLIIVRTVNSAR
ncbi:MAG: hypothetical protein EXR91_03280 [Gemmatimonadetes bacterium]|nr:hypothetical protein [Gemmatimonadota bacterium]